MAKTDEKDILLRLSLYFFLLSFLHSLDNCSRYFLSPNSIQFTPPSGHWLHISLFILLAFLSLVHSRSLGIKSTPNSHSRCNFHFTSELFTSLFDSSHLDRLELFKFSSLASHINCIPLLPVTLGTLVLELMGLILISNIQLGHLKN